MAATLRFDALKFVRKLTDAGMERHMAEAIVEGLSDADMSDLATRSDLRAEVSDLKAAIAESRSDIFRFMLIQSVGTIGLTVALIKLLP